LIFLESLARDVASAKRAQAWYDRKDTSVYSLYERL
jgi:hypothetical protein